MICKRKSKAQRMQVQRRWRGVSVRRTISWQQTAAIVLQRMERGRNARRRVAMRKAAPPSPCVSTAAPSYDFSCRNADHTEHLSN